MSHQLFDISNPILNTAANFTATNIILRKNEVGRETDTGIEKVGDGITAWNSLGYYENIRGVRQEYTPASGTDTYIASYKLDSILGYFTGLRLRVKFTNSNTGTSTINLNSFGAKSIKKQVSVALAASDILAGGIYDLIYDGTNFQIGDGLGATSSTPTLSAVLTAGNTTGANDILVTGGANRQIKQTTGGANVLAVNFYQTYLEWYAYDGTNLTYINLFGNSFTINGGASFHGAQYSADFSANYNARSLVDKGYVDGLVSGGYVPTSRILTINGSAQDLSADRTWNVGDVLTSGSYSNPSWITSLAWSKITSTPITLSGYGITDAQPLDSDLTTIAGLTATTDNFIVSVASAWASRTPAQVKTTLSLNNVENTALSTWAGTSNITTLGTITTGIWQGTSIGTAYTDAKIKTVTGTANRLTIGGTATDPTFDISTSYVGQATITTLGTIATGIWNGTLIGAAYGGTGLSSYAVGDLLYASGATALSKLADVTVGSYLRSGGVTTAPLWSTLILPNEITANYVVYGSATNTYGSSSNLQFNGSKLTLTNTSDGEGLYVSAKNTGTDIASGCGIFITNNNATTNNYGTISFRDVIGGNGSANMGVQFTDRINHYGDFVFGARNASGFQEIVRLTNNANVKIGGTANRVTTEGSNQLVLFNATSPVGALTNGCSLYSASGKLKSADAAGTIGHILSTSAVNTVSPTVPNRTLTVDINGTTYYISAKTTND